LGGGKLKTTGVRSHTGGIGTGGQKPERVPTEKKKGPLKEEEGPPHN